MSDQSLEITAGTETADQTNHQEAVAKTYTQEEFDRHMAGMKASLTKKYERQYADLGDPDELRQLKTQAESKRLEEAKNRGEFEKVLQEMAATKNAEISKRDAMIREYKVDMPLLNAAAKFKAVNPEQVRTLIKSNLRLNDDGDVEVLGTDGQVRYDDSGRPVTVDTLVREFLDSNPHFSQATPATSNTQSNTGATATKSGLDLSQMDLNNPEHRKQYAEAKRSGKL